MNKYKDVEMATKREMEQHAEIEILKKQNEILMEMGRFYGNTSQWHINMLKVITRDSDSDVICKDDLEEVPFLDGSGNISYGGKRARQAIKEVEELNIRKSV